MMYLINKYPVLVPFKYVGNGTKCIGSRYPDFESTNNIKALMEIYYSFFKNRQYGSCNEYERITREHYAKHGYRTIFFNEHDLFRDDWEQHCLNKINGVN